MRRKLPRSSVVLALAAVTVGAGTTAALRGRLAELEARAQAAGDLRPAVVAAADVPRGTRIEAAHVRVAEVPASLLPTGAMPGAHAAIGATTSSDVSQGEILTEARLARAGPVAALVADGYRALAVTVGLPPGLVAPGDLVDVLAVVPGRPFAETVASSVEVLQVAPGSVAETSVATVVLLVTPEQAAEVAAARAGAELALTVLPPGEVAMSG